MPGDRSPRETKLSDALLTFAEPLLLAFGDGAPPPILRAIMSNVALLWNLVVHERLHGGEASDEQVRRMFLGFGMPPPIWPVIAGMLATKRTEDPLDARWVVEVSIGTGRDGEPTLRASGAPPDALDAEQARALFDLGSEGLILGGSAERPSARRRPASRRKPAASGGAGKSSKGSGATPAGGQEPWRSLFRTARALFELAPWDDHLDSDVFGIEDEEGIHWCSVMGAAGTYFGVALYRGDAGYAAYRAVQGGGGIEAAGEGFEGFLVSFLDRELLSAADRRRIKVSGERFRGRGAWPQIDRMRPGRLPRPVDDEGDGARAHALLDALVRVLEARAVQGTPEPVELDGELPVYRVTPDRLDVRRERPRPVPPPAIPAVDQVTVGRLRASCARGRGALEFDAFAAEARVRDDDGWEFMPMLYLAVEAESGFLLPPEIVPPDEREQRCAQHLLGILEHRGVLPEEVRVARDWVQRAVAPTLAALEIDLVMADELPEIEQAAGSIEAFLSM